MADREQEPGRFTEQEESGTAPGEESGREAEEKTKPGEGKGVGVPPSEGPTPQTPPT